MKKRGIPCIVLGIVISVLGIFPIISGIIIDNSDYYYNYQFNDFYRNDFFWNLPKFLLIAGAVTVFIGLMLLILGFALYSTSGNKVSTSAPAVNRTRDNKPASASNEEAKSGAANHCAVIDEIDCLNEFQKIGILSRLNDFKSKTNYGIAIYIKHDDFSEQLFKSAYDFYKTKALGQSCVILMISAANSNMFISTMGNCRKFINDSAKERIYNTLRNYTGNAQYYEACIEFVVEALDYMTRTNNVNTAPQINTPDNTNTVAAQSVVSSNNAEPQKIDNVNPYSEVKTQVAETPAQPAQPINTESNKPAEQQNVSAEPQTEAQSNPYEESASVSSVPQNNFCTACGAPIGKDDKFCVRCGNKLI